MKKITSKLMALALTGVMLAGCGGGANKAESTTAPAKTEEAKTEEAKPADTTDSTDATKMEMWTFIDLHSDFYKHMADRWNEDHSDRKIDLNVTVLPYEDMHNKLQMALQAGTGAPDISDIEISKFPNFLMGEPQLVDITDGAEPYKGKVVQSRLDVYSKEGKVYGFPSHVGATVMYYNTELLEKAGVDYKTIATWDDYIAAGKKVVEKTGKKMGFAETKANWTLSAMLAQQGSDLTTADGKPNVNTPEALKAVNKVKEMLDAGVVEVCPGGQPDEEEAKGYIGQGNVASVLMPLWYMGRFVDAMPDLNQKIAIAPVPVFEKGMPRSLGLGGTGTAVTKQAKDAQLAKEFIAFAKLSEEGNTQTWEILGFDPVNASLWANKDVTHNADNKFVKYFKVNPFDVLNEVKDEIMLIKTVAASPAINNLFTTEVLNSIYESGTDPETVLKDAQTQLENEVQ